MGNGLGQPDLLPHAFAVAGDLSPCGIAKLYALDRLGSKIDGQVLFHSVEHQAI